MPDSPDYVKAEWFMKDTILTLARRPYCMERTCFYIEKLVRESPGMPENLKAAYSSFANDARLVSELLAQHGYLDSGEKLEGPEDPREPGQS